MMPVGVSGSDVALFSSSATTGVVCIATGSDPDPGMPTVSPVLSLLPEIGRSAGIAITFWFLCQCPYKT